MWDWVPVPQTKEISSIHPRKWKREQLKLELEGSEQPNICEGMLETTNLRISIYWPFSVPDIVHDTVQADIDNACAECSILPTLLPVLQISGIEIVWNSFGYEDSPVGDEQRFRSLYQYYANVIANGILKSVGTELHEGFSIQIDLCVGLYILSYDQNYSFKLLCFW